MAGFVYGVGHPQAQARANISMAAPYYGNGLYYNGGIQKMEGVTRQFGNFNSLGVDGNMYSQPMQVQYQTYYHKPYDGSGNGNGSTWVQVGPNPNPYYMNMNTRTQAIQGDIVQRGTFNGQGIRARIHGHFSVSGDIN